MRPGISAASNIDKKNEIVLFTSDSGILSEIEQKDWLSEIIDSEERKKANDLMKIVGNVSSTTRWRDKISPISSQQSNYLSSRPSFYNDFHLEYLAVNGGAGGVNYQGAGGGAKPFKVKRRVNNFVSFWEKIENSKKIIFFSIFELFLILLD